MKKGLLAGWRAGGGRSRSHCMMLFPFQRKMAGPIQGCIQLSCLMAVRGAQRLEKRLTISAT